MSDKDDTQGIDNLLNELKSLTQTKGEFPAAQKNRRSKHSDSDIKDLLKKAFGDLDDDKISDSEYDIDSSEFIIDDGIDKNSNEETPVIHDEIGTGKIDSIVEVPIIEKSSEMGEVAQKEDVSNFIIVDEKNPPDVVEMPEPEKKAEFEKNEGIREISISTDDTEIQGNPGIIEIPIEEPIPEIKPSPEAPEKPDEAPEKPDETPEKPDETPNEPNKIPNEPNKTHEASSENDKGKDYEVHTTETKESHEIEENVELIKEPEIMLPDKQETINTVEMNKTFENLEDETDFELDVNPEIDTPHANFEIFESTDDTDINMAMALGYSAELRGTVGDSRIKEASSKIAWDSVSASGGTNFQSDKQAFAYRGEEFSNIDEKDRIKERFDEDRKKLIKRLEVTGLLMIVIMLYENSALFGINLPGVLNSVGNPVVHMLISLQLLVFCAALSYKQLYSGIFNALLFTPTFMSIPAVYLAVSVIYNIISVFTYKSGVPVMFNFSTAFCIFLGCICEYMNYKREYASFTFISDNCGEKDVYAPVFRPDTDNRNTASHKYTYDICNVGFVSKYFYRTNKKSQSCIMFNYFWIALIAIGMILAVLTIAITKSASYAMSALAMPFAFGTPVIMLISSAYPLYIAVCRLLGKNGTIIGEQSIYQHSEPSIYSFDDLYAFPAENIPSQKIRLYNNSKMYEVLYDIKLLFYSIESPLVGIVDGSILDIDNISKDDVQLLKIEDTGVEAVLQSKTHILAGNYKFIAEYIKDFLPNDKDKAIIDEGNISVMYIALGGELAAKIYVTYDACNSFRKSAEVLENMGHRTAIITTDPNINDKLMRNNCSQLKNPIIVFKPKEIKKTERADCGIAVKGIATDIVYPLSLCTNIKKVCSLALKMQILATVIIMIILTLCCVFTKFDFISSFLAVVYQILLSVATFIFIKKKLKH